MAKKKIEKHTENEAFSVDKRRFTVLKYKGKISNLLHCGEIQITPFVYFFLYIQQYFNFKERQYLLERFLPLFLSAGASIEEPTIWGKGSDFLRI